MKHYFTELPIKYRGKKCSISYWSTDPIKALQLIVGETALPYVPKSYDEELKYASRYFKKPHKWWEFWK